MIKYFIDAYTPIYCHRERPGCHCFQERKNESMLMFFYVSVLVTASTLTAVAGVTYTCSANQACGCSLNSAVLNRIVGGESAGTDTWGWAVSIRSNNGHFCGGSLISPTLVITAAHCVISIRSISSLSINVGSRLLSMIRQQRRISSIYLPGNYNPNTFVNDIAVLRLSSPVDMTDRSVSLICLPSSNSSEYPPSGTAVVAVGWGTLVSGSRTPSETLQQVTLNAIPASQQACRSMVYNRQIQLCAGVQNGGKGRMIDESVTYEHAFSHVRSHNTYL